MVTYHFTKLGSHLQWIYNGFCLSRDLARPQDKSVN